MCTETVLELPLGHWDAVIQILKYSKSGLVYYEDRRQAKIVGDPYVNWVSSPNGKQSTFGYYMI